jgi:hypothetical protein
MIDFEALARERGYRTGLDPSAQGEPLAERPWHVRIPCRAGFVSVHGLETLAAYCDRPRRYPALLAIDAVRVHQRGDREIRSLFGPDRLDAVARVLGARRRRPPLSAERRAKLVAAGEPFRLRPRGPDAVQAAP